MLEPHVFSPIRHRYELAATFASGTAPNRLLDIGGYRSRERLLSEFLDTFAYESLNTGPAWYQGECSHHKYDGVSSDLPDRYAQTVISVDTLEHLAKDQRPGFINQAVRLAQRRCVIVTPFRHETDPISDERRLLDFASEHGVRAMPSLLEHEEFGLPTLDEVREIVDHLDVTYELVPATPRVEYWQGQMAMLFNTVALEGAAYALNRSLQTLQEDWLHQHPLCTSFADAYRIVIILERRSETHGCL